ncbi:acetyl-CoA synthetase-like protein [Bimuria novae-zelandiae CBS 107.79]|uniref:Acetyl-CoA synthetase-like protein n=1 Tax=Bimuria novae-zelandiae CBS 107.79 TaxID=1447943 RepID=A0A6A5V8Q9_9PLEO|nr:acetyl-CoA synthetase-like protein [Bimuria novae-zelandiae CBS 107.79]
MDTNYFVCTLGPASTLNTESKPYHTISEFLAYQSGSCGSKPAVGFPLPRAQDGWTHELLTFSDVFTGTQVFAERLSTYFDGGAVPQTVALMAHSSPEFLFTWLGLMYLGHSVLLLAPQCQPGAILHLCRACNVALFFHNTTHAQRAAETEKLLINDKSTVFSIGQIPLSEDEDIFEVIHQSQPERAPASGVHWSDVAYLYHTSGTSSGLPKPIPQSHRSAIGVLPHLPSSTPKATFTTTPLYQGGIADAFRSWTSDSPIYAANTQQPTVKYFSSVPYVLQMMEADEKGLELLKSMDIVGVGGAALPVEVGNRLVGNKIHHISRFGSAECGYLLSSYRDFATDIEWQYLRNHNPTELLDFEPREDGLAELVVMPGWPHMAKKNRDDGSFATADLFERHSRFENVWLYHSRADSQLTLITGKKFDPAPLEAAIATSEHLDDVLIFGDGCPYPGALLLRSENSSSISDVDLLKVIWPQVEKLNKESQSHARIPQHMLVPVVHQDEPLQKSSKGTIMRKTAEARFAMYLGAAYDNKQNQDAKNVSDEEIPQYLATLVQSIIQTPELPAHDIDLFSYGVDSIACMRLRNYLRQLTPNYTKELPLSVVEDCATIGDLSSYIIQKRHGEADANVEDEKQLMLDLVKAYGDFSKNTSHSQLQTDGQAKNSSGGEVVLLTGATGAIGAHILSLLRCPDSVSVIYCLVRGADSTAAKERRATTRPDDETYNHLAANITSILHIAWTVNFRLKLRSFAKDNIAGVRHLLDLALVHPRASPPRFAYCSSTAATINGAPDASGRLPERIPTDPASASPLGYSRSKWVAEHICLAAHHHTALRDRIFVVRVGQLSGDSEMGVWNAKEAWPMMLSTVALTRRLPDLGDEPLDWVPVDVAARAFLQTTNGELPVYHVVNPHLSPTWRDLLAWLGKKASFEIVPPAEWVRRLEQCEADGHSSMKLLGLWKEAYGKDASTGAQDAEGTGAKFSIEQTEKQVEAIRGLRPLDERYVGRVWDWVVANVR